MFREFRNQLFAQETPTSCKVFLWQCICASSALVLQVRLASIVLLSYVGGSSRQIASAQHSRSSFFFLPSPRSSAVLSGLQLNAITLRTVCLHCSPPERIEARLLLC